MVARLSRPSGGETPAKFGDERWVKDMLERSQFLAVDENERYPGDLTRDLT